MKKLALISAIAFSGLLYNTADAQFGIHIGVHLFPHRVVYAPGPVVETRADVDQEAVANTYGDDDFYYLPDAGAYYSVAEQLYYYFDGQEWISAEYLPGVYRDYDWRYARRFEIHEARPYLHNDFYRDRYQGFDNDLAHNHDHFREGFDFHRNRDAYNAPQHFDDRGFNQHFDNNRDRNDQHFDKRGDYDQKFGNQDDNDKRFDRGGNGQRFYNINQGGLDWKDNGGDRNNNQVNHQFDQSRNKDNSYGQQAHQYGTDNRNNKDRIAHNNKGYDGH